MIELNVLNDYVIPLETFMPTGGGGGAVINNQNKTVRPSTSSQQVTADAGYTGLGTVIVEAIEESEIAEVGALVNKNKSTHTATITPYAIVEDAGYVADGETQGASETVTASELVNGTKAITSNGTEDVTNYASVNVAVPNSYDSSDEGKVVDNGALVSQTSATYTENGTYDTTLVDEMTVNVSGSGGYSAHDILMGDAPSGEITLIPDKTVPYGVVSGRKNITKLTVDFSGTSYWFSGANNTGSGTFLYNEIPAYHIISGTGIKSIPAYLFMSNSSEFVVVMRGEVGFGSMNQSGFRGNGGFTTLDYTYGETGSIGQNVFYGDSKFNTLIIRSNTVMPLSNTSAFSNATQFRSGGTGGTLYVPQSLISSYESATNWSTILGYANNQILPIEGSIYETQYADGTPIS